MSKSLPIEPLVSSLGELLKEFGVRPSDICKVSIRRGASLLRRETRPSPPDGHEVHLATDHIFHEHEALLQCMDAILLLFPQILSMSNDCLVEITEDVVSDIVDPYLHILARTTQRSDLTANFRALWSIISVLLRNTKNVTTLGPLILNTFINLFDELGRGYSPSIKADVVISILAHSLKGVDLIKIERDGFSLSGLFDSVLSLLKQADQHTCYLVASSLLPILITAQNSQKRAGQVWSFVVDVHRQVLCVTSLGPDLILALLCCLSDVFLSCNSSSPFSFLCRALPDGACGPVFDLRMEYQFWEIVQHGLVSPDSFARKRALYLVRSVLDSVRGGGVEEIYSEESVFWWTPECKQELASVWDDLVLVLETMEEKQIHIVKPVRTHLKNVISATASKSSKGCYLLHLSWLFVALSRVFEHTEAKSVIRWGVLECLLMELDHSPLVFKANWKFVFGKLLKVLNVSMLYGRDQCNVMAGNLKSFFQRFVACLSKEEKSSFLESLFGAMDSENLVDVPLVFLTYALSQLPPASLLGPATLAHVRSIIFNGILTHKPFLRAATQHFLLAVVCKLSNISALSYGDVIKTLGSFRDSECLIIGTKSWNRASSFLAQFCLLKQEEKVGVALVDYLQKCIHNYLSGDRNKGGGVPSPSHLARALLLLVDVEFGNSQQSPRVLSSQHSTLTDILTSVLSPVLETAAMAEQRPYLPPEAARSSLEIVTTLAAIIVHGRGEEKKDGLGSLLYAVMKDYLPSILDYAAEQIFGGSNQEGLPCLEHVSFHLETLETLYQFTFRCGHPFHDSNGRILHTVGARAAGILCELMTDDLVKLSGKFLGAVTILRWTFSHMTCHTHSSMDPYATDHTHFFPGHTHSFTPPAIIVLIKELPITMMLVKELKLGMEDQAHLPAIEQWDWGPLFSHCTSSYWHCLLTFLKYTSSSPPTPADGGRLVIGSSDVIGIAECCISALDVAAHSVGIVIDAVATLIPKLLSVSGGLELLLSSAATMWPLVMELKSHQTPFWEALRAYVSVVFHPRLLLLECCSHPDVLQMQTKCTQDFLELGGAKLGTYGILVEGILRVWEEAACGSMTTSASSLPDVVPPAVLFASMKVHCYLLCHMATFGPIHKKNLRSVEEMEAFWDTLENQSICTNMKCTRYSEDSAAVRIKLITFLLRLAKRCSQEKAELLPLFEDFFSELTLCLVLELDKATEARRQYYLNSSTHRIKLRLVQTLLVTVHCVSSEGSGDALVRRLLQSLQSDNQLSVRYLLEWLVVQLMCMFPMLLCHLYELLEEDSDLRLSRMCSVLTIAKHVGYCITTDKKPSYYLRVLPAILRWCSSFHCVARLFAQTSLVHMWRDCQEHGLSQLMSTLHYLEPLIAFMEKSGDVAKFSLKMENNVFFNLVRTTSDRNIETIFYILPLLCNVSPDELIPSSHFQGTLASCNSDWDHLCDVALASCNAALNKACEEHLNAHATAKDGSDTRSIAHRLKSGSSSARQSESTSGGASLDTQKKITLLSNPSAILHELFPHSDHVAPLVTSLNEDGNGKGNGSHQGKKKKSGLVVVASLLSKIPNLGGICRTGEIFTIEALVLSNLDIVDEKQFQSLSVTAEKWMSLYEVKLSELLEYLVSMQQAGYALVGLEQTMKSKPVSTYKFDHKTVLVLGNEREGIPPAIIHLLDSCVEIPQYGTIRSLNVHVSAAVLIWEYTKQHLINQTSML